MKPETIVTPPEATRAKAIRPCPGCGRTVRVCWAMPCLHLECLLLQGRSAVREWAEAGGATLVEM